MPVLIKKVEPSIVVILTYNKEGKNLGQGSGFFINKEGDVITNSHVLQEASRATVRTTDGKDYSVKKVLVEDKESDLIRISVDIPGEAVRPLPVTTKLPDVGERIIVIGTPLGLDKTVSDGIVSIQGDTRIWKYYTGDRSHIPWIKWQSSDQHEGRGDRNCHFFVVAGQNLNFAIPGERIAKLAMGQEITLSEREEGRIRDWLASAEGLYVIGLRFLWAEEYEKALPYFIESARRDPQKAQPFFWIGYCLDRLGRYKEAIEPYKQAIRIQPKDAEIYNNLCFAYGKIGRYDEAIESCGLAIRLKPDLPEAHNNLGWNYKRLGRYQEAIKSCKEAIRLKPDFAQAHNNLGNSYSALKKYEEAIESYKETIRIQFDYAEGHSNLGAAYFHVGRFEEAIVSYKQAVRLKPSLAEAHLNLGMSYLKLGIGDLPWKNIKF